MLHRLLFLVASLVISSSVGAQNYPERPIRMIVPWPPGQATDIAGRLLAQGLQAALGQPVVVDNRAGAGGMIGTEAAAKAAPDGYTLLAGSSGPVTVNPLLQKVAYDADRQLLPIHGCCISPYLLVVNPSFPASSAKELIALVKAAPGKYSFSSSGTGATSHLITEWFNALAQLQAVHVPYKGSAPSLTDIVGNQIGYSFETLAATGPLVRSGKLKALGVSLERGTSLAPDIPSIAQAVGMPGFNVGAWLGLMAPAGLPREIAARLSSETEKMLASAEYRDKFAAAGLQVDSRRSEEFAIYLKGEKERFASIIKSGNIKVE